MHISSNYGDESRPSSIQSEYDYEFTLNRLLNGIGLALGDMPLGGSGARCNGYFSVSTGDEFMRDNLIDLMFAIGLGAALCVSLAYCFPAIYLILGGSLSQFSSICLIALTIGTSVWAAARLFTTNTWLVLSGVLVLLLVPAIISGAILDTTIDGQEYHFLAIQALANGWNPFYHAAPNFPLADQMSLPIWVDHYPIASWMVMGLEKAAGIPYAPAKGFSFTLMVASALIAASVLLRLGVALLPGFAIAGTAAANPITIVQLFTRMNDGVLASCILIIVSLAVAAVCLRRRGAFLMILPLLIFALNLKFSAIPIFFAICGFICVAIYFAKGLRVAAIAAACLAATGIVGIFGIGFAPYTNNILQFGHPFYPIMGADGAWDIMSSNTPPAIEAAGSSSAFWVSLFSHTTQGYAVPPSAKLPFMISIAEIRAAGGPDARVAGFGPFFSGALFLALALGIACFAQARSNIKVRVALLVGAAMLLITLVFPENWWARYVPQFWLVPISVAIACFLAQGKWKRIGAYVLVGVMALNATILLVSSGVQALNRHDDVMRQVENLLASGGTYEIDFGYSLARTDVFDNAGLRYSVVPNVTRTDCQSIEEIAAYGPDRQGGTICRLPSAVE